METRSPLNLREQDISAFCIHTYVTSVVERHDPSITVDIGLPYSRGVDTGVIFQQLPVNLRSLVQTLSLHSDNAGDHFTASRECWAFLDNAKDRRT